jgi:hypothetical protein
MEKNMFNFRPENRIIETRYAEYAIMGEHGWYTLLVPFQTITGWKEPKIKEAK